MSRAKHLRNRDGGRRVTALGLAVLTSAVVASCGQEDSQQAEVEAMAVLRRLSRSIAREDYRSAMKYFSRGAQENIHYVGGAKTPIEGFFTGLRPMLRTKTRVVVDRNKVWVTYTYGGGDKLDVCVSKVQGDRWLITDMKGRSWGI